jgi:hypothetical protein
MWLEVVYDFLGNQLERGSLFIMLRSYSEAPRLHLERARDLEGGSRTAWCSTIGGGSARRGDGGGGSQRSQIILPSHLECTKTALKRPVSHTYWLLITKNTVFLLKST